MKQYGCVIVSDKAVPGAPSPSSSGYLVHRRSSGRLPTSGASLTLAAVGNRSFQDSPFRICIGGFSDDRIRNCSNLFCSGRGDFRVGFFDRRTRLLGGSAASLHRRCVSALRLRHSRRRSCNGMHDPAAGAAQSRVSSVFQILRTGRDASHCAIVSQGSQTGSRATASQAQAASRQMIAGPYRTAAMATRDGASD